LLRASISPAVHPRPSHLQRRWLVLAGMATMLAGAALGTTLGMTVAQAGHSADLAAQGRSLSKLETRVQALEVQVGSQPDWTAIARKAELSIFTVATKSEEGSAWIVHSGRGGADLITNFHVVASAWNTADVAITVKQGDRSIDGTITRVDKADDLAVIHVADQFPELEMAAQRPQLGETVMAIGSPLGLGGSVSIGVISGFRSLEGSDYIQFSAPISPGNSGGPVLDRNGRVVGVASAKFVGDGVEALSLALPVQTVCITVVSC
jgi:putative serine protease PepD